MLPINGEFGILYVLYFLLYSLISYNIISGEKSSKLGLAIILGISITLNVTLFFDPEDFNGGGSLVVLFYSGLILILTFITFLVHQFLTKRKGTHKK